MCQPLHGKKQPCLQQTYRGDLRTGEWTVYINDKGRRYDPGIFEDPEDAVKASTRGRKMVQEDKEGCWNFTKGKREKNRGKERRNHETENLKLHA